VAVRDRWQTAVMPGGWRPLPPKVRLMTGVRPGRDSGGRRVLPGLELPPAVPPEPAWSTWFPDPSAEATGLRETASAEWRRAVAVLTALKLLTALDGPVLADYSVCYARLVQCERRIAADGLVVDGRRHPLSTTLADYRRDWNRWADELGLSRSARERLASGQPADEASMFDA
jgi:P27 family predicted phage terminase small subunit